MLTGLEKYNIKSNSICICKQSYYGSNFSLIKGESYRVICYTENENLSFLYRVITFKMDGTQERSCGTFGNLYNDFMYSESESRDIRIKNILNKTI